MERNLRKNYVIGITEYEGCIYGIRLVAELLSRGCYVHLIISDQVLVNCSQLESIELNQWFESLKHKYGELLIVGAEESFKENMICGRHTYEGMVAVPCSGTLLEQIANHEQNEFFLQCMNSCIGQHRNLIIVPKETPFRVSTLEYMLQLAKAGVQIVPAMSNLTLKPSTLEQMIDGVVGKILQCLHIESEI